MTCQRDFGEDATNVFNLLTGVGYYQPTKKLMLAPFELHRRIVAMIDREAANASRGKRSRIIAKMNALLDGEAVVKRFTIASQGGGQN